MTLIKKQRENRYRLGELFLETGIVDFSAVSEGLSISRRTNFPIGRVLVMTGWVDDHDIKCALEVQNLIRQGTIDNGLAKELLRFSHTNKVDISESFRLNGLTRSGENQPKLGRLLLASGIVDENQLAQGKREADRHGTTLGGALLLLRFITPKTHEGALNLLIMMRDDKVTFPEALTFCREMHARQVSLREVLGDNGKYFRAQSAAPRLGEFLISAELVQPREVNLACEIGAEEDNNIGRVLMQRGQVSEIVLEAALKLQRMIQNRVITYRRAVKLLRLVRRLDVTVEQVLRESEALDQVFALLRRAELIPERLVRDVAAEIVDYEDTVAEALLAKGYINPVHARIGLACLTKVQKGELDITKAAFLVHHCCRTPGLELDMFARINWNELKRIEIRSDLMT